MAADVCSDFTPSLVVSPRISLSHDPKESDDFLLDPSIDFDFDICINPSYSSPAISSADELFSNGKILPVEIKKTPPIIPSNARTSRRSSILPACSSAILKTVPENTIEDTKKKMLKDFLSSNVDDDEDEEDEKPPSKPFWQFRRSSSLNSVNCENGRKSNGLIKSLQFLTRSNSTGSAPNPKIVVQHNVTHKATIARSISQKDHSIKRTSSQKEAKIVPRSSSVSSSTQFYAYSSGQNACLRKSYSNVIRINPVLNITPTSFTKGTGNLFGFCSILFNSKSNKNKK
ncbi:hypothetical protein Leryth_005862 [Lithospermum erythrorhizon]|nr:hypothetical protein Leryth_005862 [Lithospermum erythrorhizon]